MEIVIEIDQFLNRLNKISRIGELIGLCREISRASSLQIKKRLLEIKCEAHAVSILGERWQRTKPTADIKYHCVKCGQTVKPEAIKRNGHYHKGLNFDEGYAQLWMPQLVHKERKCLGVIQVDWPFLEKRKRFWFDVIFNVIGYYFEGIGLRGISRIMAVRQGAGCGIMSVWRMIQRVGETLNRCCPVPTAKNVTMIGLDEIFMRLRIFQGKGKKAAKRVLYGLLIKALGKGMPLLSFKTSLRRDETQWQQEVDALYERGINYENGLRVAIRDGSDAIGNAVNTGLPRVAVQECTFHIQKDLIKLLRDRYGRNSNRARKIIKKVKAVFRVKTLKLANARLEKLSSTNKFAYDYLKAKKEYMFTYLVQRQEDQKTEQAVPACNTNNGLERENRELKKRLKIMVSFKSCGGAENFAVIMQRREYYRGQGQCWLENMFAEIPVKPKLIEKPPLMPERTRCLSGAQANRPVGVTGKNNNRVSHELPIIRTAGFGETLKHWIDGYSILEN